MYSEIQLPTGQNDYICRVMLDGEPRVLHLSYNSTGDYWTVGFCDSEANPIVDGIRIVPNFPLNMWTTLPAILLITGMPFFAICLWRIWKHEKFRKNLQADRRNYWHIRI